MIRYNVSTDELERDIEAHAPGWLARAAARTAQFKKKRRYQESAPIWSEVKEVFMNLQGDSKCAFCERKMESVSHGKGEMDIEHFRPKGSVKSWTMPASLSKLGIALTPVPKKGNGYYCLPYDIFNYAAACKPCNSALKSDRFPIVGKYNLKLDDSRNGRSEKPMLIFPIGGIDDDPERLIEFYGTSPRPRFKSGHKRYRAMVVIEFFGLDDTGARGNLYEGRAHIIMLLYPLLKRTVSGSDHQRRKASADVRQVLNDRLPHLNCAKSFERLFRNDMSEAEKVYDASLQLIMTKS